MYRNITPQYLSQDEIYDDKLSWAAVIYYFTQAINLTIKTVLPIPESLWGIISTFFGVVIVFYFYKALKPVLTRSKLLLLKVYSFFTVLFFYSYIIITLHKEPLTVLIDPYLLNVFVFWLPTGLFAASVRNVKVLYNTFLKVSCIICILAIINFWGGKVDAENIHSYNMQLGFTLIVSTLFHLNEFLKGKHKYLVLFIIEFAIIVLYANRSVLLSLFFFAAYKILVQNRQFVICIASALAVYIFIINIEDIAIFFLDILGTFDLSSRTLVKIVEESIQDSSGRDEIWAVCKQMIWEHPITGWGIGGECFSIYQQISGSGELTYAYSPHNAILQLLLQFGILGGTVATIIVLLPIFRMHKIRNSFKLDLVLIFGSAAVIPCCYSAGDIFIKPIVALYLFIYYNNSVK